MTLRIQKTTIGVVCGSDQAKNLIGDMRGLGYVGYQAIPTPWSFGSSRSLIRFVGSYRYGHQISPLRTSFFAGVKIWKRSKKSRPNRWLNCGTVLTIYNKRTIACGLIWNRIGVKMHEEAAILHLRPNRIEARSPSC